MKKGLFASVGMLFLLVSCRKDICPPPPGNPLTSKDQVVEYHKADFDGADEPPFVFPFLKKYDPSGKAVVEIDGSYDFPTSPYEYKTYTYRELKVCQKGRMVYLVDKKLPASGIPDTVLRVTLNGEGRPESSIADSSWIPTPGLGPTNITESYIYKDNRLVAVRKQNTNPYYTNSTDSLLYDQYGDLLSFNTNSYEYDYTRPSKKQFYCEGWQDFHEGFQYLEYLGYFPEVTSPPFVMTKWTNSEGWTAIADQKFDSGGRLISYDYGPLGAHQPPTTITWK